MRGRSAITAERFFVIFQDERRIMMSGALSLLVRKENVDP